MSFLNQNSKCIIALLGSSFDLSLSIKHFYLFRSLFINLQLESVLSVLLYLSLFYAHVVRTLLFQFFHLLRIFSLVRNLFSASFLFAYLSLFRLACASSCTSIFFLSPSTYFLLHLPSFFSLPSTHTSSLPL